jgi:transcriptional regulator with XRE-family HTH domain
MERITFKLYRTYMGITLQEAAEYLACTKQALSFFEAGKTNSNMLEKFYEQFLLLELSKRGIERIDIVVTKTT